MLILLFAIFKLAGQSSLKLGNPLSSISDLDRISPYIISLISSRQVIRIKKNIS